jgi:hypothetical protein
MAMKQHIITKLNEEDIEKARLASISMEQRFSETIIKELAAEVFKKLQYQIVMEPIDKIQRYPKGKK